MDAFENAVDFFDELVTALVRLEWRPAQRIYIQVPRTEFCKPHLFCATLVHFLLQREHQLFDAFVEIFAVCRGVVKAMLCKEDIVDKILAVSILRNLLSDIEQLVVRIIKRFLVLEAAFPHGSPGAFTEVAVGLFHVGGELLHGLDFAIELDTHAARDFLVRLHGLVFFSFKRNVVWREQV